VRYYLGVDWADQMHAVWVVDEQGTPERPAETGVCPLCRGPAIVTDWRPGADWVAVEGCPCGGFFVLARVVEQRLPSLSMVDRPGLVRRIRAYRAAGREVWLTTADGDVEGPLVIRTARPDRPMSPRPLPGWTPPPTIAQP
jgi:hypothetical protein